MLALLFITLGLLIGLFLYYDLYQKRRKLPPGPTPWPIMGNTISTLSNPPGEKVFLKWKEHYGPVYSESIVSIAMAHCVYFSLLGIHHTDHHRGGVQQDGGVVPEGR